MFLWVLIGLGVPIAGIAGFVMGLRNRSRLDEVERMEHALVDAVADLARRVNDLEVRRPSAPTEAPAPEAERQPVAPSVPPRAAEPVAPPRAPVEPEPEPELVPPPFHADEAGAPEPPDVDPEPPPWAPAPPPIERATVASVRSVDWEGLVGVKLFSWVAGIALVFAAVFFLRYSIEHGWLGPAIRMAIGLAVGTGLLIACEMRVARGYAVTANALDAAGIAILFATLFASHVLWGLLPEVPTFALMALVTAVAVLLSIRRDSVFIALLGLVGGFATPALLSTGADRPIGLFGYLLLLNVGLAWVAHRKRWAVLSALCVGFTAIYQWGWVFRFLDAPRLPLAMGVFLLFPIVQVAALVLGTREGEASNGLFGRAAWVSAALPPLLALYLAAVPAYGAHFGLLFGFVLLLAVGLAAVGVMRGPEWLHGIGALATVLPLAVWLARSYDPAAWPGVLGFVAVFVVVYLFTPALARRFGRPFTGDGDRATLAASILLFAFPALAAIEPATAAPGLLFTTLFVLLGMVGVVAVQRDDGTLYLVGALFAIATEAVWSLAHLTAARLLPALGIYAAFALLYLGVPLAARRWHRTLAVGEAGRFVLLASLGLLFFLATGPVARFALWGLAVLLAIVNVGLAVTAGPSGGPPLRLVGIVVSWVLLGMWWATAMTAALLLPALVVIAGFGLLVLGASAWTAAPDPRSDGIYLGLVGHLFLFAVVAHPALSVPPWPWLGILAVLDLAVGAAALWVPSAVLHVAAIAASQLVVLTWLVRGDGEASPLVAMLAADGVAAFALAWVRLARRRLGQPGDFVTAAATGLLLAQLVAIVAANATGAPGLGWLVADHVALLVAFLGLAWAADRHQLALVTLVPTSAATTLWVFAHLGGDTWVHGLVFLSAIYAVFLAYPLVVGARAGRAHEPWLAAALAGLPFLYLARRCLLTGGWGHVVAVVPLAQAALMLTLLRRLVMIEERAERTGGRVALVAGAALAFATVAIPLQLSREWITVGWALEAAALAWLHYQIRFRQLVLWSVALSAAVFVRLALNPAVLGYHPRASVPIVNWYLYTYLVSAGALFAAAYFLRKSDDSFVAGWPRPSQLLPAAGAVLLFLLLNIEIADFYSEGSALTFNFSAGLAQDLTYTLGWATFAIVLLAAGIARGSRTGRIASLALLVVTVVKAFLHDLWRLGGLYRVGSFVGLALCLTLVALLLQRFAFTRREAT